ncbi:radical SAM protein [Alphaproteobacteria bacterium]|nr:radical SAM protein [Alphaproteobacteria bacterium]
MINKNKYLNKKLTMGGKPRASVKLNALETLWINTGTLCNLNCQGCYIESSPYNNSLEYIKFEEVKFYIDEIVSNNLKTSIIGFTGGEPFMNPDIIKILKYVLNSGFNILVLTNGMRPIKLKFQDILNLPFLNNMKIRVSIDHFLKPLHEKIRGINTWDSLIDNIVWLKKNNIKLDIASRLEEGENEIYMREGFKNLFKKIGINLDANDKKSLVLFPPMNMNKPSTEITQDCWKILNKKPEDLMCSNSRMIVKKKGEKSTKILACTLITKDKNFELGKTIMKSNKNVTLCHPFCSQFCFLGNSSCN